MDHNAYNKIAVSHIFNVFAASDMDRWHIHLDAGLIEHKDLKKVAAVDGTVVLNFYPEAVRDLQMGVDCLTVNIALGGRRTHVVVPYEAIRSYVVVVNNIPVWLPANILYVPPTAQQAPAATEPPKEAPRSATSDKVVQLFPQAVKE